jgi:ankyrin repeat protein
LSEILQALYDGDEARVAVLLAEDPELDVFEAAALGRTELVGAHLDADPSLASAWAEDGFTPLHLAAFFRHPDTARLLVERGAPVDAVARHETIVVTPLQSAVAARQEEVAALLLERGADPNARQEGSFTPLHGAAASADPALVELLLRHGADPALAADDGRTAADFARDAGDEELARRLATG